MKNLRILLLLPVLLIYASGCVIVTPVKHDNGKHKGWYKNRNNPHNPKSKNPGHSKHLLRIDVW